MFPDQGSTLNSAATGRQRVITGDGVHVDGISTTQLTSLNNAGGSAVTYLFAMPAQGSQALDVDLLTGAITGTGPTVSIYRTMLDHVTQKGSSVAVNSGSALAASTAYEASITTLRGEEVVIFAITVPASSSVAFQRAEFSTL